MKILKDWRKYPQANSVTDLVEKKIYRSWRKNKKLVILYRGKVIHFGDKRYSNYGIHTNKDRLKNYLTRSANIRDSSGRLTANNPMTANFWSRKVLWNKNNILI